MSTSRKILLVQCAGLGYNLITSYPDLFAVSGLSFSPYTPIFPAVTCTAQATMRTGLPPYQHGIVANGRFDRRTRRVDFWQQSARLVDGERFWQQSRSQGKTVAMLFYQQSLGETVDYLISPAPIHKHHGGMLQACQTKPPELETVLKNQIRKPFHLSDYWGPRANRRATEWITEATLTVLKMHQPDLVMTYLPHLDYCQQSHGPDDKKRLRREIPILTESLRQLLQAADQFGYDYLIWGDYAITPASQPIYPNRVLRHAGLFLDRKVNGLSYPNLYDSRAFAMCDHQVAHVYVNESRDIAEVSQLLEKLPGIAQVATPEQVGLKHPESGELVLTAAPGAWFAYQWWDDKREAPDYASHVDIHSKIGFDPCELFWNIPMISIGTDCRKVKGTHGRNDQPAAVATSENLRESQNLMTLTEKSNLVKNFLELNC